MQMRIHVEEMKSAMLMIRRFEKDDLLNLGDLAELEKYLKKWETAVSDIRLLFNKMKQVDPAFSQDIDVLQGHIEQYVPEARTVLKDTIAGKYLTSPIANKEMSRVAKVRMHDFEDGLEVMKKKIDVKIALAVKSIEFISFIVQILPLITACIALVFLWTIYKSISVSLHEMKSGITRMGEGDFSGELEVIGEDELADMTRTLNVVLARLRTAIGQVKDEAHEIRASSENTAAGASQLQAAVASQANGTSNIAVVMEELSKSVDLTGNQSDLSNKATQESF
jgi:methyl-accepting chemotaxis protein